jgi:hypothetical protein
MATTTPNYGWTVPTSTDYVADGAVAIETLGDSVDATLFTALGGAYPGLRLVKKQTIGTGVSSVVVTGAFNATYENYKVFVIGGAGSAQAYVSMILGSTTTGYYGGYSGFTYFSGSSSAGINNGSSWIYNFYVDGANGLNGSVELFNPFVTKPTYFNSATATNQQQLAGAGLQVGSTSHTAFTLTPNSGTLTGGTVYVYGYGVS